MSNQNFALYGKPRNPIFAVYRKPVINLDGDNENSLTTFSDKDLAEFSTQQANPDVARCLVHLHPALIRRIAEDKAKAEEEARSVTAGVE